MKSFGRPSGNHDFGTRLQRHIKASLYSYGQVAKLSGVPKRTIANWLDGTTSHPRHWQSIVRVAAALRLARPDTDELLAMVGLPDVETLATHAEDAAERELLNPWILAPSALDARPPQIAPRVCLFRYLESLARSLEVLPAYFPPHAAFTFPAIYQDRFVRPLESLPATDVVPTVQVGEGEPWSHVRDKHLRVVILGQPGYGKSWLLKSEAMRVAQDALALATEVPAFLPVLVRMPEMATHLQGNTGLQAILRAIAEVVARATPGLPEAELVDALYTYMHANVDRVVFLIDALDEVPRRNGLRTTARRVVVQLGTATRARIVLTSRVLGYAAAPLGRYVGKDVAEYELMPFANREILRVLRTWFYSQNERMEQLQQALRRAPALARQATNPLLLSLMCMLTEMHGAELTGNRIGLYEPVLRLLLEGRWRNLDMQLPESRVRAKLRVLEVLAWNFATYRQTWWEQLPGDVLDRKLDPLPETQRLWATWHDEWGTPYEGPLWELSEWDGILIKGVAAVDGAASAMPYAFLHRTFQEFLVARFLLNAYIEGGLDAPEVEEFLASKASNPEWHLVRLLLVELLTHQALPDAQPLLTRLSQILLNTVQDPSGQMAVAAVELLLTLHHTQVGHDLAHSLRDRLCATMRDVDAKAATRIHAARLVAEMGDPRAEIVDVDALAFVEVPAGDFWMGSDGAADGEATREEFPLHRRSTRSFAISCYPVSNAQYYTFLHDKDDGFDNPAYWAEAIARGHWQDGKVWRMRPHYQADGAVVMEPVWTREPYPTGWPTDLGSYPIHGISWYEARAFVRWLETRWRALGMIESATRLDLPTEAEWEKAARGTDARIYPWGNRFDGNRLNWYGHLLMAPAAIGIFPHSASPYGAEEMVGNLWEWTRSVFTSYEAGEAGTLAFEDNVRPSVKVAIRGGAYFSMRARCRCAARSATLPYDRIHATFRIVKYLD